MVSCFDTLFVVHVGCKDNRVEYEGVYDKHDRNILFFVSFCDGFDAWESIEPGKVLRLDFATVSCVCEQFIHMLRCSGELIYERRLCT